MILKRKEAGFTLIELLVVIAIVGVLSGVVIQSLNSARAKSRNASRSTQIDQLHKAMEISATLSGTNKLPYSGTPVANLTDWRCLGLTTGTCWNGIGYSFYTPLNNTVAQGIAGKTVASIPKDPFFPSNPSVAGDYYLYHSNVSDINTLNCNPTKCPAGAYLSWAVESSTNCGRGVHWGTIIAGKERCLLRIGNAVTN